MQEKKEVVNRLSLLNFKVMVGLIISNTEPDYSLEAALGYKSSAIFHHSNVVGNGTNTTWEVVGRTELFLSKHLLRMDHNFAK